MIQIERSLKATLTQLQRVLAQLNNEEYARPLQILSNASIGQHTRHIIEFFHALNTSYDEGVVNYDKRKRNPLLEAHTDLAQRELALLVETAWMEDKDVQLIGKYSTEEIPESSVRSTYHREIVYTLEHAIHHMAMIRIGVNESTTVRVPLDFGVAASTVQHRRSIL